MIHQIRSAFATAIILFAACHPADRSTPHEWPVYRGDDGITAYSPLDQIDTANVKNLKPAWTFRTGDNSAVSSIECNPIIVHGILYGVSPKMKVFALDAATGKPKWTFDPFEKNSAQGGVSRGVTFWENGGEQRIFFCASYKLFALDARTGKPDTAFATRGFADMRKGLRDDTQVERYSIQNTSPGVVFKDLIIVGSSLAETYDLLPGNIRAYNVHTGKQEWIFHTIPEPGDIGYNTWPKEAYKNAAGCNAWSGLSLDRERGMLFAATGAPAFDFHGGERAGNNLFANSVIALDAATGKYIWHFQVSHHDLWDYDLPCPPILINVKKNGVATDAVAQLTKQGFLFLLDRKSGKPLYEVKEQKVPSSTMPDEYASLTQPFPVNAEAITTQGFDSSQITDISPESQRFIREQVARLDHGDIYTPPNMKGIVQLPGFRGGGEWSGGAFDPNSGMMYIGANNIANLVQLVELKPEDPLALSKMPLKDAGGKVFVQNCASCHGADRNGGGEYPSLLRLKDHASIIQALETIEKGRNRMPSFSGLPATQKQALLAYLFDARREDLPVIKPSSADTVKTTGSGKRYKIKGYTQLRDQFNYPGTKPPWGTLNAYDVANGKVVWKQPLGAFAELSARRVPPTGTQLFGGGIVTKGGILFIGASQDEKFRAINVKTGAVLWEFQLPAGGYATPATYEVNGRQFVVIAAGGGGFQTTQSGDYYLAFSL